MPTTTQPRADVCTPKRPRRKAAAELPYPAIPAGLTGSDLWLIHVQRDKAKLEALRAHAYRVWSKSFNGPLADALAGAIAHQEIELKNSQEYLADALDLEQRGVPA